MIKCSHCGAKNQTGTIFCSSCGNRLDMEDVERQVIEGQKGIHAPSVKKTVRIVRRVVSIALLLLVLYVLVGFFLPVPIRVEKEISGTTRSEAIQRFNTLVSRVPTVPGQEFKYRFSSEEATAVANWICDLGQSESDADDEEEDAGFLLAPERIYVELLSSGYVRCVLVSRVFKKMNVYSVATGRFEIADGRVRFRLYSAANGRIRMIGPLKGVVTGRYTALMQENAVLDKLRERIDDVDVEKDEAILTVAHSDS